MMIRPFLCLMFALTLPGCASTWVARSSTSRFVFTSIDDVQLSPQNELILDGILIEHVAYKREAIRDKKPARVIVSPLEAKALIETETKRSDPIAHIRAKVIRQFNDSDWILVEPNLGVAEHSSLANNSEPPENRRSNEHTSASCRHVIAYPMNNSPVVACFDALSIVPEDEVTGNRWYYSLFPFALAFDVLTAPLQALYIYYRIESGSAYNPHPQLLKQAELRGLDRPESGLKRESGLAVGAHAKSLRRKAWEVDEGWSDS